MRSRITVIMVLAWVGSVLPVQADMIETKARGVMNGKIISQDDQEVRFEDSAKNLLVVPKKDVLFLEAQTDAPMAVQGKATQGHDWNPGLQHWKYKAERIFENSKSFFLKSTKKIRGAISAPLDRSSADSRSDALASSMGDLSTNLKTLSKQDRKRTDQLKGIKDDKMHASIKTKSRNRSSGTFSSLD